YGLSGLVLTATSAILFFFMGLRLAPIEMCLGVSLLLIFLFPLRALNSRIKQSAEGSMRESENFNRHLIQGIRHYFFLRIYNLISKEVGKGEASLQKYERLYRRYYLVASFKFTLPLTIGIL